MKVRSGFVANSSSTYFIIVNKTKQPLTLAEFVRDTVDIVMREYSIEELKGEEIPFNNELLDHEYILGTVDNESTLLWSGENEVGFHDWVQGFGFLYREYMPEHGETKCFKWRLLVQT